MLKIRMQRVGRINQPSYRIVVTEHTASPKAGKFVEKLGTYNPHTKARTLDEARVKYWMSVGAQPSATVHNMLVSSKMISGKKINVLPSYKAPEAPVAEAPAAAAPAEEVVAEVPAETPAAEAVPVEAKAE